MGIAVRDALAPYEALDAECSQNQVRRLSQIDPLLPVKQ
jgi:hypothetical protein